MIKSCGKQLKPFDKPATELQTFYPYLQMSSILQSNLHDNTDPANIYLFKVNNRKRCKICSKLTIKTPERRQMLAGEH